MRARRITIGGVNPAWRDRLFHFRTDSMRYLRGWGHSVVVVWAVASAASLPCTAAETEPLVAAASSVKFALTELAARFTQQTGRAVRLSYGSSGNLARQILHGAPYEVFLSADELYPRTLSERALTVDDGIIYATGRLALFVPTASTVNVDARLSGVAAALGDGRLRRFAIANPGHAPYGRAARELLQKAELWERIQGRLAVGENVAQAAQFIVSGAADAGIISYSLAVSPGISNKGRYVLLDETWHRPLRHRMVLLRNAGETARAFYRFLGEAEARRILSAHGFGVP